MKGKISEVADPVPTKGVRVYSVMMPPPGSRPPCPNCDSGDVISKGIAWRCKVCQKNFRKITRVYVYGPPCCECGGKTGSRGEDWKCRVCGRNMKKGYRGMDVYGPPCCECGGKTRSRGEDWKCLDCGRYMTKKYRRRENDNQGSKVTGAKTGNNISGCVQPTCPTDANRRCPLWSGELSDPKV
jgi:tRNA(Ile2) C34 agmatinyltransferase TiaS